MKKFLALLIVGLIFSFGQSSVSAQGKILVAYFSRIGEEYGVGNITKGNTAIVAEIIAKKTGADLFEIKTVKSYPNNYDECTKVASREKAQNARPELATRVNNFDSYDTIFIGSPVWYSTSPMAIYTFLESYNFSGKKIIPFVTHAGSGLGDIPQRFSLICPDAEFLKGLAVRGSVAQNNSAEVESKVEEWLEKIKIDL